MGIVILADFTGLLKAFSISVVFKVLLGFCRRYNRVHVWSRGGWGRPGSAAAMAALQSFRGMCSTGGGGGKVVSRNRGCLLFHKKSSDLATELF